MLSLHCRKRSGVATASRLLRLCNYHSYPDPDEVPVIKTNLSSVQKQIEKSKGPWKDEFLGMKNKFNVATCFPGVKEAAIDAKAPPPVPEMTKLDNGLTVVSIKTPDMTMSSFAFLINAGRYALVLKMEAESIY
jgi:hypothetical protein